MSPSFSSAKENGRPFAQSERESAQGILGGGGAFLFAQGLDRFEQRQPGVEQRDQLLAEERHREALAPAQGEHAAGAHLEHGVAAAFGLAARAGFIRGLQRQRLDAAVRGERLELEPQAVSYWLLISAFSPVPPGCPSLPYERMDTLPFSPSR